MGSKLLPNVGHRNLRRGSTKGEAAVTKKREKAARDPKVKGIAQKLINRPGYRAMLAEKLDDGTLHPSVQVMLWQYAHGKPKDEVEVRQIVPVTIKHEYSSE